MSKMKRMEKTL